MEQAEHDHKRLLRRLHKNIGAASIDYNMLENGDKIMVCLSGGKDSYTMLDMMLYMQKVSGIDFSIVAVNLDQKQPGFPEDVLPKYLSDLGVEYLIVEKDTYSIVKEKVPEGKTMCSLCSRLRRGNLYTTATEIGATKIALGHHRDDLIETLFLNMFFSGKIETMPAKYRTDNGEHMVIRPLAYCKESDIEQYSVKANFPIIPCTLCGSQEGMQRQEIKKMLREWNLKFPGRIESIFTSMQNISPTHMMDHDIHDFKNIPSAEPAATTTCE